MRAEGFLLLGESELRLKRYAAALQAFQSAVEVPGSSPRLALPGARRKRARARGAAEVGAGRPLLRRGGRQEPGQDAARVGQGAACGDRRQAQARSDGKPTAEELDGRKAPKRGSGGERLDEALRADAFGRSLARAAGGLRRHRLGGDITVKLPPPDLTGARAARRPAARQAAGRASGGRAAAAATGPAGRCRRPARDRIRPAAHGAARPPRTLACNPLGTVLGVASELLECGRARYQRGELEEARVAFRAAIQESSDRRITPGGALLARRDPAPARPDRRASSASSSSWSRRSALRVRPLRRRRSGLGGARAGRPAARARRTSTGCSRAVRLPCSWPMRGTGGPWLSTGSSATPRRATSGRSSSTSAGPRRRARRARSPTEATFWLGETLGRLGDYKGGVGALRDLHRRPPPRS